MNTPKPTPNASEKSRNDERQANEASNRTAGAPNAQTSPADQLTRQAANDEVSDETDNLSDDNDLTPEQKRSATTTDDDREEIEKGRTPPMDTSV